MSSVAVVTGDPAVRSKSWPESRVVTWVVIAFLAWVPLCTPVALLAWQSQLVSVTGSQAILLVKDAWAVALIVFLFLRHRRDLRIRWYDWVALAYAGLVFVYSVVPVALGSNLTGLAVVASARELLVPVELYAVGRLAGYAGVETVTIVTAFLVIAAAAAVFAIAAFVLATPYFWLNQYQLVNFIRVVQGIPHATDISQVSILTTYGGFGSALRAVGPFTHPVGAGVYFAMPLALVVSAAWLSGARRKRALIVGGLGLILFTLAVLTPISRGTWIGFAGAVVVGGVVLRRYRLALLTLVIFAGVILLVPPFSWSVQASFAGNDPSTNAHIQAVTKGVTVVTENPVGSNVTQGDSAGQSYSATGDAAGVGENMYLTTYASLGPLGLIALVVWLAALIVELLGRLRPSIPPWIPVGVGMGLLAEVAAGMSASTLMRFTNAASICLLVGLMLAEPSSGSRTRNLALLVHPRRWFASKSPES